MDVLITGTGLVGSNAAARFIDERYTVVGLDVQPRTMDFLENAGTKLKYIQGDVTDLQALESTVKQEKPKILVHTTTPARKDLYKLFDVSVRGTANILEVARKNDLRLVYISSGTVYGQLRGEGKIREDQKFGAAYPPREQDSEGAPPYCMTKRLAEQWAAMYRELYGLQISSLRLGIVYGRGDVGRQINAGGGISLLVRKALAGQPLHLPYGGDTYCTFVNAIDVADAIFKAATVPKVKSFAYNVTYEKAYWMKEAARIVMKVIPGSDIKLGPGLWPSKGIPIRRLTVSWPSKRQMDITRAKRELGYKPVYDLPKGVQECAAWMKKNWHLYSPEVIPFPA